jgi:hypothetical protein
MNANLLESIHESLLNGQRTQMTKQIDEYGLYDFFEDYNTFLSDLYDNLNVKHSYFLDCVVSYSRIKNR